MADARRVPEQIIACDVVMVAVLSAAHTAEKILTSIHTSTLEQNSGMDRTERRSKQFGDGVSKSLAILEFGFQHLAASAIAQATNK